MKTALKKTWPSDSCVRKRLDCDVATGQIKHRPRTPADFSHTSKPSALAKTFNTKYAGKPWGQISGHGHHLGEVDGVSLFGHHVVWMFANDEWPELNVNHKNGNPADNRISNLRIATNEDVSRNLSMNANNKSGVNGVYFDKTRGKWVASIKDKNQKIWLGRFDIKSDAADARAVAEAQLGYYEGHGKRPSKSADAETPARACARQKSPP